MTNENGEILILLTNSSRWQITYYPRIQIKEAGFWPEYPWGASLRDMAKPRQIEPFTLQPVAIIPPTNAVKWRLWIDYVAATERDQKVLKLRTHFNDNGLSIIGNQIQVDEMGRFVLPESDDIFNRAAD